jgi:DNA-binding transcriptional ArsR family regulator
MLPRVTSPAAIARSLAALGHESRLAVFRLLVRAGREGLNVGEIGAHLDMPASTLAHHLRALVEAGLVVQERRGREVVNRADYEAMQRTLAFLTAECCAGVAPARDDAA